MTTKVAILASGSGSNAESLIRRSKDLDNIEVSVVITDNPKAGVISRCQHLGIPYQIVPYQGDKEKHERNLISELKKNQIDWVLLAGYMRLLSSNVLNEYSDSKYSNSRIINIHPSLLPKYKGLNAYQKAFEAGDHICGVTVHYVNEGMDTGEIIIQKKFERDPKHSFDDFVTYAMKYEYSAYGEFLDILNEKGDPREL